MVKDDEHNFLHRHIHSPCFNSLSVRYYILFWCVPFFNTTLIIYNGLKGVVIIKTTQIFQCYICICIFRTILYYILNNNRIFKNLLLFQCGYLLIALRLFLTCLFFPLKQKRMISQSLSVYQCTHIHYFFCTPLSSIHSLRFFIKSHRTHAQ